MNGYERIRAALEGKPSDKVPVMLHNFMMAAREYGITMKQYRENADLIAECMIAAVEKYKYDGILLDLDTVTLAGALGVPVDFPEMEPARLKGSLLQDCRQVDSLPPVKIENYKYVVIWLEAVRKLKDYFKDEIYIRGNCDQAAFSIAGMLRGGAEWMTDLCLQDEAVLFGVLEYSARATEQFLRLMAQTGCDMLSNGDSPAGPDLIPPDMYVKFALPYEKMAAATAQSCGLPYALHICGNTELILKEMMETGADALELDYKTDINRILPVLDNKVTFIGNIDPSGVLALGTPELVRKKTEELLFVFRDSNRFILNAGCAIPPITPAANLTAMIETARAYR